MERLFEFILNHYIYSIALAVVTYLLIQELFDSALKKYSAITPMSAVTKMNDGETLILDVREAPEFVQSHIEQAVNAPLGKLSEQLPKFSSYKQKPVLIACQNGTRSLTAAKQLTKQGFEQVFVISGGMQSWEEDYRLPVKLSSKSKASA